MHGLSFLSLVESCEQMDFSGVFTNTRVFDNLHCSQAKATIARTCQKIEILARQSLANNTIGTTYMYCSYLTAWCCACVFCCGGEDFAVVRVHAAKNNEARRRSKIPAGHLSR
ncbi:hypothetical protein PC114_g21944 [Phytophthora cactorum]|uniref:Uncharacterized protein n=1 Tax=Phytophthora cactorum TaxID=29920 RepID=A0A8T1BGN3_9STRA|nr:hypothetical protein PC114_g21944 [Phytophthora cactorum]KAG2901167.1 hypothetical protein PC117_g21791 [Phytophthora cactorum]KAG3060082.1 hypothetical protein PC122_g20084 [Phytophthora cactorum]